MARPQALTLFLTNKGTTVTGCVRKIGVQEIKFMNSRILHVVGGMNRGGVETWLMHVLRHIDRKRYQMDFLVQTEAPCAYNEEIRSLGSRIISCLGHKRPWVFARNFARALREHGPYDVIHSHVHHYSGFVLYLAFQHGITVRIAHSHNDTRAAETQRGLLRRIYLQVMKTLIHRYATQGIAASAPAAASLFSAGWQNDPRWKILHCGIDLTPFSIDTNRSRVCKEIGIPADTPVIGHVGSFSEQKNYTFLLDVTDRVIQQNEKVHLLLVGDGPLRTKIEEKARVLGIAERLIFIGSRDDVPRLMKGGMDVFLFPSLYEGLGLALIEAQAAGLPCVISDVIPREADVVPALVTRLSLEQSIEDWGNTVVDQLSTKKKFQEGAFKAVLKSPFSIEKSVENLMAVYGQSNLRDHQ
jgi:glycosyltransferase involved in cell wall biosynthesis